MSASNDEPHAAQAADDASHLRGRRLDCLKYVACDDFVEPRGCTENAEFFGLRHLAPPRAFGCGSGGALRIRSSAAPMMPQRRRDFSGYRQRDYLLPRLDLLRGSRLPPPGLE